MPVIVSPLLMPPIQPLRAWPAVSNASAEGLPERIGFARPIIRLAGARTVCHKGCVAGGSNCNGPHLKAVVHYRFQMNPSDQAGLLLARVAVDSLNRTCRRLSTGRLSSGFCPFSVFKPDPRCPGLPSLGRSRFDVRSVLAVFRATPTSQAPDVSLTCDRGPLRSCAVVLNLRRRSATFAAGPTGSIARHSLL